MSSTDMTSTELLDYVGRGVIFRAALRANASAALTNHSVVFFRIGQRGIPQEFEAVATRPDLRNGTFRALEVLRSGQRRLLLTLDAPESTTGAFWDLIGEDTSTLRRLQFMEAAELYDAMREGREQRRRAEPICGGASP